MRHFILLLLLGCSLTTNAQLVLHDATPQYLVQNEFLGSDYSVFNVQYSGYEFAYAQFDGTNSNLGLNRGFVLTTGAVNNSILDGRNNDPDADFDASTVGYYLLDTLISPYPTYDAVVLEFDFIPSVDTLMIPFVFGSEEYEEYVGSTFTDVMAVFLTGPGISVPLNIALLPDNNYVCPNNVCPYVSNTFGVTAPKNGSNYVDNPSSNGPPPDKIQFDGFTKLTRVYTDQLIPGATYHLVIAIADAGDSFYDSAVFFEACPTCNYALGVDEPRTEIRVFPNPVSSFLNVSDVQGDYRLIDVLGLTVKTGELSGVGAIDVRDLSSGVYYLMTTEGSVSFVKE